MACARLIVDIDSMIVHIAAQVSMGANQAEVVVDQYNQLLSSISMLRGVDLDGITCISQQLVAHVCFLANSSEHSVRALLFLIIL